MSTSIRHAARGLTQLWILPGLAGFVAVGCVAPGRLAG